MNEIRQATHVLRERILSNLRGNIPLSKCLNAVSTLRAVDSMLGTSDNDFSLYESQIRREFLECRDAWLDEKIRSIPSNDAYQYVSSH